MQPRASSQRPPPNATRPILVDLRPLPAEPRIGYTVDMRTPSKLLKFTADRQSIFLTALAKNGEVVASAAVAGVTRQCVYDRQNADPEFRAACKAAKGKLLEELVAVARKLAIEGLAEKVYDRAGKEIGEKVKFSERVLLKWLARVAPAEWGDKLRVDQKITAKVTHRTVKPKDLSPESRAHVRGLLDSMRPSDN